MALSATQLSRNKVATLSRHRPKSRELVDARRDLAAIKIEQFIRKTVDSAPPLTIEQRERLATILRGGRSA